MPPSLLLDASLSTVASAEHYADVRSKNRWEWSGKRLPDRALLVRGAPMNAELLKTRARQNFKKHGVYGVSVFSFRHSTPHMIATRARLPHDGYCCVSARRIRKAGFDVQITDEVTPGHMTLTFSAEPTDEDIKTLVKVFGRVRVNKTGQSR